MKSKLFQLLDILSERELSRLKRFLSSPFFTRRKDVNTLFEVLVHCRKKGKRIPEKAILFQKVFPHKSFNGPILRGTMSDLQELIEAFLITNTSLEDELQSKLDLAKIYRQRKAPRLFQSTMKEVRQLIAKEAFQYLNFHQSNLDYQTEWLEFQTASRRTGDLQLEEMSKNIDTIYLTQKLRHACTQRTHQQVSKKEYPYGLLPHLLEYIEAEGYLNIPSVAIYYYCYRFLSENFEVSWFHEFKNQLFLHSQLFPVEELKGLYLLAINFCIRKRNEGAEAFGREGLELYKKGLEGGYLLDNEILSHFTFNNIVGFGLQLEEYEWVGWFISNYKTKLTKEFREHTVQFNSARLNYALKNYEQVLKILQTTEFKDLVNQLIAKTIQLKIYYELEEMDLLESHLDSFQIFIRRKAVSDFHQTNFNNIIRFVRKIISTPILNKAMKTQIQKEIESTKVLSERKWLLEQTQREL